jgi:hypothetical protein
VGSWREEIGMDDQYDEAKFAELLLYVARRLEGDPAGGALKLNTVLFFAEFAHVRAQGRPITGAEYQKLENGPAPRRLLPVRQHLIEQGEAQLRTETYLGRSQKRLVALRDPDESTFTAEELKAVDEALAELHGRSETDVSALSREEVGWRMVGEGDTIPYEAAYLRPAVRTEAVSEHAARLAAERSLS